MNDLEEKLLDKIMDLQRIILEKESQIRCLEIMLRINKKSSLDEQFFWN